jgi:uncharacterized C2H2 Zn-finger protein
MIICQCEDCDFEWMEQRLTMKIIHCPRCGTIYDAQSCV